METLRGGKYSRYRILQYAFPLSEFSGFRTFRLLGRIISSFSHIAFLLPGPIAS